jgi:23S rRNA (uracil1939-C5)-methyltransferase
MPSTPEQNANFIPSLTMEKPVYGGDSLAHLPRAQGAEAKAGKAIFVPLTLPRETISARIIEQKRTSARAELEAILTPSPHRVQPLCPHFGPCGGCHYQHADYPTQLALKQQILRESLERAGVLLPAETAVLSGNPWSYRNRIRLAVDAAGRIGYRGRGSHQIVLISECPIAAPILIRTALQAASSLADSGLAVTEPAVTEIELFCDPTGSQVAITLFRAAPTSTAAQRELETLQSALPQCSGIQLQLDDGALNPKILAQSGSATMTYPAAGVEYQVPLGAFFQVNRWLAGLEAPFVDLVTAGATGGSAWDLYSGGGLFARQLSTRFQTVIAVESAPASQPGLQINLAGTNAEPIQSTTLDYLRQNRLDRQPRPDFILLDPPRAGLGDQTASLLNAIGAPEMVYVSCDPTTLARDLRALTSERYQVHSLALVDMFPQTFHIESVVKLRRK